MRIPEGKLRDTDRSLRIHTPSMSHRLDDRDHPLHRFGIEPARDTTGEVSGHKPGPSSPELTVRRRGLGRSSRIALVR